MTSIQRPRKLPRLPDKAQEIFAQYLGGANKGYAHALDWGAFYDFIIHCHEYSVSLGDEDIRQLLLEGGFPADAARELAEVYCHGRALLKRRISLARMMRALERAEREVSTEKTRE